MSSQTTRAVATGALLILATGCRDDSTQPSASTQALLADAFVMTAPGFDSLSTSFPGAGFTGTFAPRMRGDGRGGPMSGGPGMRAFMGGGIGDAFIGGIAAGPQRGRGGPFGGEGPLDGCTFDAASGDVTCTPITRDSLVITRRFRFTTAAGTAQARRDSTTDRVATTRTVTGSTTFAPGLRRGFGPGFGPGGEGGPNGAGLGVTTARTTVNSSSSQVVTGLAAASASRTVNGASAGTESTTGTRNNTAFTSQRVMGDTTTNLVIPNATTGFPYPTAGTVVRSMRVTVTSGTESPVTSTRREVVTYDGSATARVVITQDGETRNCTMPLPRGRLTCQ